MAVDFQVTASDPKWVASEFEENLVRGVATFAKSNGITTQTLWTTFIAGLTAGQSIAIMQKILGTVRCLTP